MPGLVILGHYGFERWENGRISAPPPPPGVPRAEAELQLLLDDLGLDGVRIEDKGRAVAVHTRRSPDPEGALAALREPLARVADKHGLVVEPGRMVLELRPPGMDKGTRSACSWPSGPPGPFSSPATIWGIWPRSRPYAPPGCPA